MVSLSKWFVDFSYTLPQTCYNLEKQKIHVEEMDGSNMEKKNANKPAGRTNVVGIKSKYRYLNPTAPLSTFSANALLSLSKSFRYRLMFLTKRSFLDNS